MVVQVRVMQRVVGARQRLAGGPGAIQVGVSLIPEDQRDVDLAYPEHPQRIGGFGLDQRHVGHRTVSPQRGAGSGGEGAERGSERREPDGILLQADVRREFGLGGFEPAQDLLGALGEKPARVGQPDPAARPLHQLRAGLGLEPGHVMANRRLGVIQRLSRRRHGPVPGDRDEHPEPGGVQHALNNRSN